MAMSHWSRRSFIVLAAACAFGGFLMGSSFSDDKDKYDDRRGAEGRFQLTVTPPGLFVIFDTRTARGWIYWGNGYPGVDGRGEWKAMSSPFDVKRNPGDEGRGDQPNEPAKKFGNVEDHLKGQPSDGDQPDDENGKARPPLKIKTKIIDGKPRTNGQ